MRALRTGGLFVATLAIFYGVPRLVERAMIPHVGYWLGLVVLGDVLGSGCLFAMGLRRLGVSIYLAMTAIEAAALRFHLLPAARLAWIADAVPALVLALIVTMGAGLLSWSEAVRGSS